MTEQTLLRLAMVLQNQAPSTLNKYICKLAEAVLLDYPDGVSLFNLSNSLNTQFNLAFTEEEIKQAISRKGQNRIIEDNGLYTLSASAHKKLLLQTTISEDLNKIVDEFLQVFSLEKTSEQITALLLKYFYYCFNSNVDNLLSLFENRVASVSTAFEASTEDITIINDFITWDNAKKDALVYSLIATCYEYCMLTIKKDKILSSELFKGKRFYLDANIIFRMTGINNEERKTVTQGFIKHCRQVGIELYCTSTTLDEVFRVIAAQVEYIKGIAGQAMPVSCEALETINPNTEINDFYRIYYNWCQEKSNKCGDYSSFSKYLLNLAQETLSQLKIKESSAYKVSGNATQYTQQVTSLKTYKNTKRTWRHTSTASAETDITNIMDTLAWRTGTGTSIWQTNDFIVSADQLLISWSDDAYSGVPIVVLPSVWLSIILRFTGRTDDDYKSFCLFMTQRHHINTEEIIDPIQLLKTINSKTNQTEIKEQIIAEIVQNKSQYSFKTPEEYNSSTEHAFDKVLETVYGKTEQQISQVREEMQQQLAEIKQSTADKIEEEAAIRAATEREKTIVALSKKKAADAVHVFRNISHLGWFLYVVAGLAIALALSVWLFEIEPIYSWSIDILPEKAKAYAEFIWGIITIAVGLISAGIGKLFTYLGSEDREKKLYDRFYKENTEALSKLSR